MKVFSMLAAGVVVATTMPLVGMCQEGGGAERTRERVTVVQPGPGNETVILQKERESVNEVREPKKPDAQVARDTSPRKARVVVVPAVYARDVRSKYQRELNEKWGITDQGALENPGYTSFLVDALVHTRKLDVLEREDLRSVIKELDFGESDYADMAKVVKMGQMVNADYVVIPEIRYLGFTSQNKDIPYVGQQQQRLYGKLSTNVRVVDVRSSRISSSNMDDTTGTHRVRVGDGRDIAPLKTTMDSLYKESSIKEASRIVDVAYPIRVVAVEGDTYIINRGKGAMREGELLDIYSTGSRMKDPDTGEDLGLRESLEGRLKVVTVKEKTSDAVLVKGKALLSEGSICRRVPEEAAAAEQPAPEAPRLD